jgi:tetratricopeptide (TPR) repeat protein
VLLFVVFFRYHAPIFLRFRMVQYGRWAMLRFMLHLFISKKLKYRFVLLSYLLLSPMFLGAQEAFLNPFFNENNFFTSASEKEMFRLLEQKKTMDALPLFLTFSSSDVEKEADKMRESLNNFYAYLDKKRHGNDLVFLRKIFSEVHRAYLKKYQRYATFDRLIEDGSYDCLTGTAIYAMVLDHYGFACFIHETSLHSYLIVQVKNRKVLFETTDPLEGFITDLTLIAEREDKYSQEISSDFNNISGLTGYRGSQNTVRFFNEQIGLKDLAGLHYFNQAVIAYNIGNYRAAVRHLEKAYTIYPSKRILLLLLNSVQKILNEGALTKKDTRIYAGKTNYYTKGAEKFFN